MLSPEMRSSALKNRVVAATLFILTLYLKSICCEVGAFILVKDRCSRLYGA